MIPAIDDHNFDRIIEETPVPLLVEFWQPGCGHCQALIKELNLIQQDMGTRIAIFTMNVQENYVIPADLEIQTLPTLALFIGGKFERFIGGMGKKHAILSLLATFLENPS